MKYALSISTLLFSTLIQAEPYATDIQPKAEDWSFHFQATTISQGHAPFPAQYSGKNSLIPTAEFDTSLTATLFLGRRLWKGGEAYVNPELTAGKGVSSTQGVAGFPNGEIYRVGTSSPKGNLSRLFVKQVFALDDEVEWIDSDKNQLRTQMAVQRLTLVAGKFSLNDFFDENTYSHDPRTQYFNWALMDNGAWDYAADTRGYTWGVYLEYNQAQWSIRLATAMVPKEANQLELDTNIRQAHGDELELEHRHKLGSHPGTIRILGYMNHAHMGSYAETLANPAFNMDVTQTRDYRTKYGLGFNAEQEITFDLGAFFRMGWNNGATETWAFTEIDRTITVGARLKGNGWNRAEDVAALALILNGLSKDHADYLAAGGYGFIIGDGRLSYAPEQIIELYYLWKPISQLGITADFQFVNHPAYNQDRGPAFFYAARVHYEI